MSGAPAGSGSLSPARRRLVSILEERGVERRPGRPVELASGRLSDVFVDAKRALARWEDLSAAAEAVCEEASRAGIGFTAVGGPATGAVPVAVAVAAAGNAKWFSVRGRRGPGQFIDGAGLGPGDLVLMVDDVATTGGSVLRACEAVAATGALIVAASAVLDRGGGAADAFAARGVPYLPAALHCDLGLPPA